MLFYLKLLLNKHPLRYKKYNLNKSPESEYCFWEKRHEHKNTFLFDKKCSSSVCNAKSD